MTMGTLIAICYDAVTALGVSRDVQAGTAAWLVRVCCDHRELVGVC